MKLVISFVIASLFCFVLVAPAEAQEAQKSPAIAEGRWAVTPLAPRDSQVPGAGDMYFQMFSGSHAYFSGLHGGLRESQTYGMTDDGMVVFWAALGDKSVFEERARLAELMKQDEKTKGYFHALASSIDRIEKKLVWTLCSFKGGTFRIIVTDGVKFRAPDGKERSVKLASSKVVFSRNAAFVRVGGDGDVWGYFGWNGERFDTFIQPRETFVADGRTYTIKKVYDMGRTVDGTPWVLVDLKERSDRQYVCIWSETKTLVPMLASGDPNPILEGKTVLFRFTESIGQLNNVLLGLPQWVNVGGPGLFSAVYLIRSQRWSLTGFPGDLSFALNRNGQYQALFVDKAADQKLDPQKRLAIYSGHFLSASPVVYVFAAGSRWMERRGSILSTYESARMYVSTGGAAKLVGDDVLVDSASIRAIRSPRGTILTCGARKESTIVSLSIGADGKLTAAGKSVDNKFEPHVLVVGDSGVALRPAPRINVTDSKETFLLSDVVGWINENEAVAIRDSGLFQLKKIQ